jgi:hypothetical protein
VFGDTLFQPAFGEGHHRHKGDDDTFDEGIAFLPVDSRVFDIVKKALPWARQGQIKTCQDAFFVSFFSNPLSFIFMRHIINERRLHFD